MTPIDHARTASDAVHALARTTMRADDYEWPSDIDAVVSELALTVMRLDQVLTQAGRWLKNAESRGDIGHDESRDVAVAVLAAHQRLRQAASTSAGLVADLNAVREITAHLTGIA